MTTFNNRGRAFENRYAHDEEMRFLARARATRTLALWAADKMGVADDIANAYGDDLVAAVAGGLSDTALARRVADDLAAANHPISLADVEAEMRRISADNAPQAARP